MSDVLTVRFPSGATEFRMSETAPEVGDVLRSNGDTWVVEAVIPSEDGTTVVALRPRAKPVQPDDTATPAE